MNWFKRKLEPLLQRFEFYEIDPMFNPKLVVGLLHDPAEFGSLAVGEKYRDLTLAWCRYGYQGTMVEGDSLSDVLQRAMQTDAQFCLVLRSGCLIWESWSLCRSNSGFWEELDEALDGGSWHSPELASKLQFGTQLGDEMSVPRDQSALLVKLRPDSHCEIVSLSDLRLDQHLVPLNVENDSSAALFPFLGTGVSQFDSQHPNYDLSSSQFQLLAVLREHTENARNGIGLWNIESYDDVRLPLDTDVAPLQSVYCVAQGFKSNALLDFYGFNQQTRVVFFDYSLPALNAKRWLIENWDGREFPKVVRKIFEMFPSPQTYYHLWDGYTDQTISDAELEWMWDRELANWECPATFYRHWQQFIELDHEFVHCDLLDSPRQLLDVVQREPNAILWWSNAFFTMYGNWLLSSEQRKAAYENWVAQLVGRNPELYLVGSDFNNTSVNGIRAGDYWEQFCGNPPSVYSPSRFHELQIRM